MKHAIVRELSESYVNATWQGGQAVGIDLARARAQHHAYVEALVGLGLSVTRLPALDALPDACFVEDQAVIVGEHALVTRSGHPGRRAEADSVALALQAAGLLVSRMEKGQLDGGDVLHLGDTLFVGQSARTDAGGVDALRATFGPRGVRVVSLPVNAALHLKCVVSSPAPGVAIVQDGAFAPAALTQLAATAQVLRLPESEGYAANVVGANGAVLVPAGFPSVLRAVRSVGLSPIVLDMSEIAKGDGALTCLSLRW